jgi:hypothetical protein
MQTHGEGFWMKRWRQIKGRGRQCRDACLVSRENAEHDRRSFTPSSSKKHMNQPHVVLTLSKTVICAVYIVYVSNYVVSSCGLFREYLRAEFP